MIKLTLQFKGRSLKVFPIRDDIVKIGRDEACDITIDNLALAPLHAVIEVENDNAKIIDKSNGEEDTGVVINATKVKEQKLEHNDVVHLGKYSLKLTREETSDSVLVDPEPAAPTFPQVEKPAQGWLQFMSGPKLGRTIKLENTMMRLGKAGKACAMISAREGTYYISHLEGEPATQVGGRDITEERAELKDGDMLKIGETQMLFFIE